MNRNKKNNSSKFIFGLIIISFFVRIFGFFREIILAKYFGATLISDSYKIVVSIPSIVLVFIGTGIATSFIPLYLEIEQNKGPKEANEFLSNSLNVFLLLGFIFCIFVFLFPSLFIDLFAYGFRQDERHIISVNLLKTSIFSSLFSIMLFFVQPFLQMKKKFYQLVLIAIPMNLTLIISYPLAAKYGYRYLTYGLIVSSFSQILFLIPTLYKNNFKCRFMFNIKDENFISLLKLSLPITIGVATQQINTIIDRNMSSSFLSGGVSALDYSNKLITFLISIIATSIITVFYPSIATSYINKNINTMKTTITKTTLVILIILVPATFGFLIFSNQIIKFIYERGSFTVKDTLLSSQALFYYAFGLVPIGLRELLIRIFNSMKDNKTPTINSIISVIINLILNLILSRLMGLNGLALATSLSLIIGTFFLIISLIKNNKDIFDHNRILKNALKILYSSGVMSFFSVFIFKVLLKIIAFKSAFIITILLCIFMYLLCIIFFKVDFIKETISDFLIKHKK